MTKTFTVKDQAVTVTYYSQAGARTQKSATCDGCPARLTKITKTSVVSAFRDDHRDH